VNEWSPQGEHSIDYEYDLLGQLRARTHSDGRKISYRYDPFGNRVAAEITGQPPIVAEYDWAGRVVRQNGQPFTSDGAGNLISYLSAEGTARLGYDGANRLKLASTARGSAAYQYDGDGNLVARTAGGERTDYLPDPTAGYWRPLRSASATGDERYYL